MHSVPKNFPDFLEKISQFGEKIALIDYESETIISYSELCTLAHSLSKKIEISEGERVILYDLPSLEWIVLFFALQIKGAIVVPLDTRIDRSFIQKAITLTQPKYIFSTSFRDTIIPSYSYSNIFERDEIFFNTNTRKNTDPCQIIFTSGTWSLPKGVTLSQHNILKNVEQILSIYPHLHSQSTLAKPVNHHERLVHTISSTHALKQLFFDHQILQTSNQS